MGLLDGLEKLINEHGSAVILKERIALINDRYEALERKAAEFETENRRLKRENEQLTEKLRGFEKQTAERQAGRLEEIKEKILLLLVEWQEASDDRVARNLNVGRDLAQFHLDEMADTLVRPSYVMDSPTTYELSHEGRRYLAKHGLLK